MYDFVAAEKIGIYALLGGEADMFLCENRLSIKYTVYSF